MVPYVLAPLCDLVELTAHLVVLVQTQIWQSVIFENKVQPGDRLTTRSIIGSEFLTEFIDETRIGPFQATKNRLTGQCWIYAKSEIHLATSDPFPEGFILSDTWGQ